VSLRLSLKTTILLVFVALACPAYGEDETFHFESIRSVNDMTSYIRSHFALGASRDNVRKTFVEQGKATLVAHPTHANIEKYLYDINLCSYYIWRWNISADYDAKGNVLQVYMNDPATLTPPGSDKKATILKMNLPQPEAYKGEKEIDFMLIDGDSDLSTTDDQLANGIGPSFPDPANLDKTITYQNVDPWRSIFDKDAAAQIVPYADDCDKADMLALEKHSDIQVRIPHR